MAVHDDDHAIIEAGYKPQLRRSVGFFSSFAISFSYMSVLTGIFANYGFVLNKAGGFGMWSWWLVVLGHGLTALVFAEMAGRMPLAGCAYNWNNKLANPFVGWFTGWMTLFAYSVGVAAVTVTFVPLLQSLLGYTIDPLLGRYLGVALVLLQAITNIYGVRVAALTNLVAVGVEIICIVVFGLLLLAFILIAGQPNTELLTTVPAEPTPYLPGFLMSVLLGAWTMLGFEGAADISEETVNVRQVAPRGIITAVVLCGVLGFLFLAALTLGITDLPAVQASDNPLMLIVSHYLGDTLSKIFLVFVLISVWACALVNMTGATRVLFAMSRDGRFIASQHFRKVSSHHVPHIAVWFVALAACGFVLMADTATALYSAGAVLFILVYFVTTVSFALNGKKLPPVSTFSLGVWHWPVTIAAILWLAIEIGILTIPAAFFSGTIATGGVLTLGLVLYLIKGRFRAG